MQIQVEYRSDSPGEIRPERFFVGKRELAILEIVDRWIAPHQSYFKVKADDGAEYILRWDSEENLWQITFFTVPEAQSRAGLVEPPKIP